MGIGLDNPVFAGRIKRYDAPRTYQRRPISRTPVRVNDVSMRAKPLPPVQPSIQPAPVSAPKNDPLPVHRAVKAPPTAKKHSRSNVLKRELVARPKFRKRKAVRMTLRGKALMALAVVLFVFGIATGIMSLRTNKQVAAQVGQLGATKNSETAHDVPDEREPTPQSYGAFKPAADLPRYITIDKIGVKAVVYSLGTKAGGELRAPSNIYNTGWYAGSSKPGQAGAMLIDGHVHGPTKAGVFYNLKKLGAGDVIKVTRGDGQVFSYKVVKTKTYDANNVDMAAALVPVTQGKPGLNLITCTGQVKGNDYEQRLMVFAEQL